MILQTGRQTNAILVVAAGLVLLVSPSSSLSEEPSLALGQLPNVPIPSHNLQFNSKVELGKLLFFDPRLSKDGSGISATFHGSTCNRVDWEESRRRVGCVYWKHASNAVCTSHA